MKKIEKIFQMAALVERSTLNKLTIYSIERQLTPVNIQVTSQLEIRAGPLVCER